MTAKAPIEIALSKKKLTLIFLGSVGFVGLGLWFINDPQKFRSNVFGNQTLIFIIGVVSILFFGLVAVMSVRKLLDKRAGLTISKEGIVDNYSAVSAGLIPWADIKEIKVAQVMNQKFLMLIVENPQYYIDKVTNPLKRKTVEMNYKNYGSPISISANTLQTQCDSLHQLLNEKLREYKP